MAEDREGYQANMLQVLARSIAEKKIDCDDLEEELVNLPPWRFRRRKAVRENLARARVHERLYLDQLK